MSAASSADAGGQRHDQHAAPRPPAGGDPVERRPAWASLPRAHAQSAAKLIRGAGATFPAPLYQKWIEAFEAARPEFDVEYDAVGSGEGISRLITGSVDFAASDAAMTDEQIAKVEGGVRMIPATAGLVSIIYNVPGLAAPLKLPRDLLPAIFTGEVTEWDDPRIAAANPGADLPSRTIAIVARLDSQRHHLRADQPSERLERGVAEGARRRDPGRLARPHHADARQRGRGRPRAADRILDRLRRVRLRRSGWACRWPSCRTRPGAFVGPSIASGEAALAGSAAEMPENLRLFIADPAGPGSYPIATFSWLLLYAAYQDDAATRAAVADFVRFGLTDGQASAAELGYIPLPAAVAERSLTAVSGLT